MSRPTDNKVEHVQFSLPYNQSRRFWTTHKNTVLEWRVEFSSNPASVDIALTYINGPSESIRFQCSIVDVLIDGTDARPFSKMDEFARGEKRTYDITKCRFLSENAHRRLFRLKFAMSTYDSTDSSSDQRPYERDWMIDLYDRLENADSSRSNVRLVSGDDRTFYCHRFVLESQSDAMDAMFRNATTEDEKSGTFRLAAWSADELRKILQYFYASKPDLSSSTSDQLMNIYDFAEQHGLVRLKKYVEAQLWKCAAERPTDSAPIARFAELHLENGLKPLKYRCFDVLVQNYSRLELNINEMFEETPSKAEGDNPPLEKSGDSGDDDTNAKKIGVASRLMHEFTEYACRRVEGVRVWENIYHWKSRF